MKETARVLFVDDEEHILSSIRRALIDEDYESMFASSGKEALAIMSRIKIAVIVSDMRMPEMDGLVLLKKVKELYPDTIRIVLTGYTQLQQVLATINQADVFRFLTKPWKLDEEFRPSIKLAIEYYNLTQQKEKYEAELLSKNKIYQNILKKIDDIVNFSRINTDIFSRVSMLMFSSITDGVEKGDSREAIARKATTYSDLMESLVNFLIIPPAEKSVSDVLTEYTQWFLSELLEPIEIKVEDKLETDISLGYRWIAMLGLMKFMTKSLLQEGLPEKLTINTYSVQNGEINAIAVALSFSMEESNDMSAIRRKISATKKTAPFMREIVHEAMLCIKGGYSFEETVNLTVERFSLLV